MKQESRPGEARSAPVEPLQTGHQQPMLNPMRWAGVALPVLLAFVVMAFSLRSYTSGVYAEGSSYIRVAVQAGESGTLSPERPPLYPTLLIVARFLTGGRSAEAALATHIALAGAFSWLMVALLAAVPLDARGRLVVAAALLCNLQLAREFAQPRETLLYSALLLLWLLGLAKRTPVLVGLAGSLLWVTRPSGIIHLAIGLVYTYARLGRRESLRYLMGSAGPVVLWVGYLMATAQPAAVSGTSTGLNLYKGNNPHLTTIYPMLDVDLLDRHLPEAGDAGVRGIGWALPLAAQFWREQPVSAAMLLPVKAAALLGPVPTPFFHGTIRMSPAGGVDVVSVEPMGNAAYVVAAMSYTAVPLWLLALVRYRRWDAQGLVFAISASVTLLALLHVLTFAETRFRIPYDPLMAIAGGLALGATGNRRTEAGDGDS